MVLLSELAIYRRNLAPTHICGELDTQEFRRTTHISNLHMLTNLVHNLWRKVLVCIDIETPQLGGGASSGGDDLSPQNAGGWVEGGSICRAWQHTPH